MAQVAPSEATVLITGESGTGKEMIAGAIHFNSLRKEGPFIKINCAAITETLLESELFGHEKGAFTGADRRKEGKFRQADGGTYLSGRGERDVPGHAGQAACGSCRSGKSPASAARKSIKVDVRVIAATNRDLLQDMAAGRFREDLYYRLNVVTLHVPPLRDRREDIPLLAQHFLTDFAEENHKTIRGFTPQAMDRLLRYAWPGNVRELMNAVERGVVLSRLEYMDEAELPLILVAESTAMPQPSPEEMQNGEAPLEEVEKTTILKILAATEGNKSEAARRLGITRRTLHQKLKKWGMM